jgi:hypothetical protein
MGVEEENQVQARRKFSKLQLSSSDQVCSLQDIASSQAGCMSILHTGESVVA